MPTLDNFELSNYGLGGPISGNQELGNGAIFRRADMLQTSNTTPTEVLGVRFNKSGGTIKVRFNLWRYPGSGNISNARVYVNDIAYGTVRTSTDTQPGITFEETVSFRVGDKVSIYIWSTNGAGSVYITQVSMLSDFLTIEREG
ncbi:hypothetical protein [Paenibacillus sp. W2I17]|uniref:hypothetical protein n=1 Tax=Paenibacillus sp. W2I17 TaxID=3042311 RepID=UPI0027829F13|nr:hypothetical protein [Paenibacillus sp. W2I17]MDQ0658745.1 hypothetical protein [Paenibacillus sp. W2I17]